MQASTPTSELVFVPLASSKGVECGSGIPTPGFVFVPWASSKKMECKSEALLLPGLPVSKCKA